MKKFKFQLDPFLRYREHLEKEARLEVAKLLARIEACETAIATAEGEGERTRTELEAEILAGIDSNRYQRFNAYLAGIQNTIDTERKRRHTLLKALQKQQEILAKRSVEKKALENLKERRRSEYIHEMGSKEQQERDEMAILRRNAGEPPAKGE